MTYSHTNQPSALLGHLGAFGASVREVLKSVGHAIEVNSTAHRRLAQVHNLQAKTDEELAALGVKRDEIVHRVFRDLYYI